MNVTKMVASNLVYLTPGFCVDRELQESDAFYRNE